ncbi:hypothetical protein MPL1032_80258 [Mesorhizobium plurifarium]|uniref:Uncharacterized protein n=1 Tax=Mesorhizobium plurifarium TaxID=69974 RepID=A0A0K2W791_MESPL|nr:hypothetical protein MPL1032_80258 [Mesorhizobium plurifarium]
MPCVTGRAAAFSTAPQSSTSWPSPASTETSPAVRSALGPISHPILPAPSCTGAPTILQRMILVVLAIDWLDWITDRWRFEQTKLAFRED